MTTPVLDIRSLEKHFGSVSALENFSIMAYAGEIHAIVGDNGAGKSTAVKIITGIHTADAGEVHLKGELLPQKRSPSDLASYGISVVYQDLALVESLDIATNLALGALPTRFGIVDRRRMRREAEEVLADLKVRVTDVTTPVGLLSGGQRQVIAVARAARSEVPLLLLDEPTAALGVQETGHVGEIVDELREKGRAIVVISHDLNFVFKHADRVTVLRLGHTVGTRMIADTSRDEVIGMITGAIKPDVEEEAA